VIKRFAVVLAVGLVVAVAAFFPISTSTRAQEKPKGDVQGGKALYEDNCQKCHGDKGQGVPRMYRLVKATIVHLGAKEAQERSDEFIRKSMTDGFGKMEAIPDPLTPQDLENIVAFVRTLKQEPPK